MNTKRRHRRLFKHILNTKGFTLIELVMAIAILSIISVTFYSVFSSGYSSIFYSGVRSNAMAQASSKMELLYALGDADADDQTLEELLDAHITPCESQELFEYPDDGKARFCKKQSAPLTGINGLEATIVVFYNNGEDYVSLNSFIKGVD